MSGSYGRVYLGMNATTGAIMAVKQVERPTTRSDQVDKRQLEVISALKEESAVLQDLDHENIVQYLGFEEGAKHLSMYATIKRSIDSHSKCPSQIP